MPWQKLFAHSRARRGTAQSSIASVLTTVVALAVLGGCAAPPTAPVAERPTAPSGFPTEPYEHALAQGAAVYRIEPERSDVVVRVYRGGSLARFGHDHVVASRDVRGYVALAAPLTASQADLYLPVDSLQVDEPARRAQAGFDTQPSQSDIDGTRRNMTDKVLEAQRYPFVVLHLTPVRGEPPRLTLNATLTVHGTTRTFPVEVEVDTASAGTIEARGRFTIRQTDFGMTPYALFGGALRVEDKVDIDFLLHGSRIAPGAGLQN